MHLPVFLYAAVAVLSARLIQIVLRAGLSPNRNIPGPFLARFTRLYYLLQIRRGRAEEEQIALHRYYAKPGHFYAPIIRLGPDLYSITEADKQVYGVSSKMAKSAWYEGWKHPSPDRWTMFVDRNIQRHNETRKKFQAVYSLSSLVSYEKYADDCISIFQQRLTELAERGDFINLRHWLQCYAFDVIGDITYSKRFGFLDQGQDVDGVMRMQSTSMPYSAMIGVYAWAHPYLYALMQRLPGSGAAGRNAIMAYATGQQAKREAERSGNKGPVAREEGMPEDFLDKLIDMKADTKRGVTDYHIFIIGLSNLFAGSDTTAISLSAVLYHLIKTPSALKTLRAEIDEKTRTGKCEETRVSFKDSQDMPYLQACIKEGLRLHPATGLPLWRVVDQDNTIVGGESLPAGAEVGINTWVAHYNEDIWGTDVKTFRPERWLEAEKDPEHLKVLEANYLPFGLGSRTCIGKHISYLEMTKLIPQMVRMFDFELQHPDKDWSTKNVWFVMPIDFFVKIKLREW